MNTNSQTSLLSAFAEFYNDRKVKLPYNFNVLDEQCGHIMENSHTNMLMKLLQYKNQYGYIFLESFFSNMGIDISIESGMEVEFYKEKYYNRINKNGRIDGLIYQQNKFALIIENKVNGAGNQEEQLKKYIEGVLTDPKIFNNGNEEKKQEKIWVMFLTKNGAEKPDKDSWEDMQKKGICEAGGYEENDIHGSRYVAINYQEHILPWLKEEIQPTVMQKEQVLNTGLLQYIDFLEGMLGMRQSDTELLVDGKNWLIKWINENVIDISNGSFNFKTIKTINSRLDNIKKDINKQLKEKIKSRSEDIVDYRRYAGLLNNLLDEINDEPMKDFFEITRNYFESNGLMTKCVISHIFNYYYIQIRDVSWPRSVHFEWYPLGVKRLNNPKQKEFTFCFHVENAKIRKKFEKNEKIKNCFNTKGFSMETLSRTLTFKKTIDNIDNNPFLNKNDLDEFLETVYGSVTNDMIEQINKILKEN